MRYHEVNELAHDRLIGETQFPIEGFAEKFANSNGQTCYMLSSYVIQVELDPPYNWHWYHHCVLESEAWQ